MASDQVKRKLAAILAADIAGYSRLMGADEAGTLARLKEYRRELIDPKNKQYRGRVVKTTGDGILIEFPSVVDAISCSLEVQQGMRERNADIPPEKRIEFRIGINLGDVIVEGRDLYGDGVNISARLEGLAEPGGICISQTVLNHSRGKIAFEVDDLGEQALKNIVQPVHVYRLLLNSRRSDPVSRSSEPALALPDKPSIAVLPFQNMSDRFYRFERQANEEALRLFKSAIKLDPDFASAFGRAACCYSFAHGFGWMCITQNEVAEVKELTRRAVEFGRDDAVALASSAFGLAHVVRDLSTAAALIDRALMLNSNLADAWYYGGWIKNWLGEPEPSIVRFERAMRLSPLDPSLLAMRCGIAHANFFLGH